MLPQVITWIISLGSLGIAIWALTFSRKNDARQNRLEERQNAVFLREKADKNSDFKMERWDYQYRSVAYLVAHNNGGGSATNLRGHFRGDPTHILGFGDETRGPIEPGQTFSFGGDRSPFPNDGHPQFKLREPGENDFILTWTDSYGDERSKVFPVEQVFAKGEVDELNLPPSWATQAQYLPIHDAQVP
ncbi:hypothetical protein AHiyo6_02870 [Arthrobacter sp. Hiyo6]|nr:hypothetical protein AHiyo6_02870 [Arthrobacter sp. Hiyo6]